MLERAAMMKNDGYNVMDFQLVYMCPESLLSDVIEGGYASEPT